MLIDDRCDTSNTRSGAKNIKFQSEINFMTCSQLQTKDVKFLEKKLNGSISMTLLHEVWLQVSTIYDAYDADNPYDAILG